MRLRGKETTGLFRRATARRDSSRAPRLHLHLGLAKTGTTYLQGLLAESRPALQSAGTIYPFLWPEGMFHGAVDVVGQYDEWAIPEGRREGTWDRLVAKAESFEGAALISHEILALASAEQAGAALERLAGFEVHLVVTVRDLARQLPAYWQESVKNGSTLPFAAVADEAAQGPTAAPGDFWVGQDVLGVLERWGATAMSPDRVHVVTCPPPGAAPRELWRRFAAATALPDDVLDPDRPPANPSLGCTQTALLRSLNTTLVDRLGREQYIHVVKRLFAQRVLSATEPRRAPRTPEALRPALEQVTEEWTAQIRRRGYQVHGDLSDLAPVAFADDERHPDDVAAEEIAQLAPPVSAALLLELAELRGQAQASGPPPPQT